MSGERKWDAEWSLFLRALTNIMDLGEKLYVEDRCERLSPKAVEHYKDGIVKFTATMVLISQNSRKKHDRGMKVPFVVHQIGNA